MLQHKPSVFLIHTSIQNFNFSQFLQFLLLNIWTFPNDLFSVIQKLFMCGQQGKRKKKTNADKTIAVYMWTGPQSGLDSL